MSKPNRINKVFILFIILAFILGFFTPVLADYIGPNRSVTTYEVEAVDYGVWAKLYDGSCTTTNPGQPQGCIVCEWEGSPGNPCGDAEYSYKLGTRFEPVAVTTTYPAATVNGTLQNCTLQNGWCVTSPQLQITANEPVSGYHILLIEGIYNSEIFACAENPCIFPFATEGNHAIEYWALSSWGDSSRKGTLNVKVDTVSPNLNLLVNGTLGQNYWYVSDTIITAEGADGTSGVYEKVLSIDSGTTWIPSTTLTEGVYQVDIKVTDHAYNLSTASTTISVDTTTPTLSLSISGTKGNNNYYISKPKITATTLDATSGVALVQTKIDNNNWINANEITIEDGIHTYQFRAYDNAGNMTETPVQNIKVDTTPPSVEADTKINLGDTLFYTLEDKGSGLAIERIVIEDEDEKYKKIVWLQEISGNKIEGDILWDGKFPSNTLGTSADKTVAGVGEYFITFKISDRAGNETFYTTIVNVNPISYLQSIPEFIIPESVETSNESASNEETGEQNFGGEQSQTNEGTEQTFELATGVSNGMASSNSLPAPSLILTGALAITAIAAAMKVVNDAQKKREEEEAQSYQQAKNQAAKLNKAEEERKANLWWQGQINNFYESLPSLGLSEKQLLEVLDTLSTQGLSAAQTLADNFHAKSTTNATASHSGTTNTPATTNNPFVGATASGSLGTHSSGNAISNLWNTGVNFIKGIGNELINQGQNFANNFYNTISGIANGVGNFLQTTWTNLVNWGNQTYTNIVNTTTSIINNITTSFQSNPTLAWSTAGVVTLATVGAIYYVNCNGLPVILPPHSSIINFAGVFSLPAVGWLTTSKKQKLYGIVIGMLFFGMLLSACGGGVPATQNPNTPTPTLCPSTSTPSPTTVPPTQIPSWLNLIPSQLSSNWGWVNENIYNDFILNTSNTTGVPYWILKAVIANESGFDINADSGVAKGLGQITGYGIGAVLSDPTFASNSLMNNDVNNAYFWLIGNQPNSLGPVVLLNGKYLKNEGETYLQWYNRISYMGGVPDAFGNCVDQFACDISFLIRSKLLEGMDAQPSGNSIDDEINQNLIYSAFAIQSAQNDIANSMPTNIWATISNEDKWLLTFAQYNIGAGNSQSVVIKIVQDAISQGKNPSWGNIAPVLSNYANTDTPEPNDTYAGTVNYANSILNLAQQGGE